MRVYSRTRDETVVGKTFCARKYWQTFRGRDNFFFLQTGHNVNSRMVRLKISVREKFSHTINGCEKQCMESWLEYGQGLQKEIPKSGIL